MVIRNMADKLKNMAQSEKGFSLLELLVATTIFSVGLLAVASMQTRSMTANATAQRMTSGSALAQSVLEDMMARESTDAVFTTAATGAAYDLDRQTAATTQTINGVTYTATYSIAINTPVTNVAQVDISVVGGGRTFTLTSFKRSA